MQRREEPCTITALLIAKIARRPTWTLVRQPVLLAFLIGCTVSIAASGRVSARLVLDGALSFAFVPIVELGAFALVYRRGSRGASFAQAVDTFFLGNAPWLVVLALLAALTAIDTPQETARWTAPPRLWIVAGTALVAIAWSMYLDIRYFESAFRRSRAAATADALLVRAIAWPIGIVYFVGYAIWPIVVQISRGIRL